MITDEEVDFLIIANSSKIWRKVARVVGFSISQTDTQKIGDKNDLYFANRVNVLVNKGLLEYEGDLNDMRNCEIRLKQNFANS